MVRLLLLLSVSAPLFACNGDPSTAAGALGAPAPRELKMDGQLDAKIDAAPAPKGTREMKMEGQLDVKIDSTLENKASPDLMTNVRPAAELKIADDKLAAPTASKPIVIDDEATPTAAPQ